MRPPSSTTIAAPMIPTGLPWVNVAMLRIDQQKGRPVLIEFNDLVRPSSLRTTAYLKAWHRRYGGGRDRLRVITVLAPALDFTADGQVAEQLVAAAGIVHPVLLDLEHRLWRIYEVDGWPTRYLFDRDLRLFDFHFGEGGYDETEAAIRELLADDGPTIGSTLHPIDRPDAQIVVPSPDTDGAWSGDYEAGEVWAVLEGRGTIVVNGQRREVISDGPLLLVRHDFSRKATLAFNAESGVICHRICFSPGLVGP